MVRIEVNRNAPLERGTGNAQILQARLQEVVEHFIAAALRLNEFRMILNVLDQTRRILAHAEEIRLLLHRLQFTAADRALSIRPDLARCIECFALLTVHAIVVSLVDIALVIELLEDLLYLPLMVGIRRADELVIGDIDAVKLSLDFCRYLVNEFLRCQAGGLCLLLDLLTMFIRAGLEADIVAALTLAAGDCIRQHNLINVTDMRLACRIGDCSCNVIRFLFCHRYSP